MSNLCQEKRRVIITFGLLIIMFIVAGTVIFGEYREAYGGDCCKIEKVCDDKCCDSEEQPYCVSGECVECENDDSEGAPTDCHECVDGDWIDEDLESMEAELEALRNHIDSLEVQIEALEELHDALTTATDVIDVALNLFSMGLLESTDPPEAQEVEEDIEEIEEILEEQEQDESELVAEIAAYKAVCGY